MSTRRTTTLCLNMAAMEAMVEVEVVVVVMEVMEVMIMEVPTVVMRSTADMMITVAIESSSSVREFSVKHCLRSTVRLLPIFLTFFTIEKQSHTL